MGEHNQRNPGKPVERYRCITPTPVSRFSRRLFRVDGQRSTALLDQVPAVTLALRIYPAGGTACKNEEIVSTDRFRLLPLSEPVFGVCCINSVRSCLLDQN